MPARRRAPKGCWLPSIYYPMANFPVARGLGSQQQNVKLFLRQPLAQYTLKRFLKHCTFAA
jgi:hypothetical protein